jgi:1-deoxy-D-xylulose-5-phosphate synthase
MSNTVLSRINSPEDLKKLDSSELQVLAEEVRRTIISTVSQTGGHLASNLGVVELTIALHRVFESPRDKLIWDVGHQCYTHKLLTGRRQAFHTLRQAGGLSGFPKRAESRHDILDTGHSSTAISAGLGLLLGEQAVSRPGGNPAGRREGRVIVVIGDGALTAGLALEGLNQAGQLGKNLIIILNDNKMSIGANVGALSAYLSRLTTSRTYQSVRSLLDLIVRRFPRLGRLLREGVHRLSRGFKAVFFNETLFSDLGFHYVGPIDGHNLGTLIEMLERVRSLERPVVVHVQTRKGKGFPPAEQNPTLYHGVSSFSLVDGKLEEKHSLTYTEAFSSLAVELAEEDERITAITAAMATGTGLRLFGNLYPERFFDVGITEQHAVTFAAGLALAGRRPLVALYSSFLQRAVDQVIHDVALPGLPVVLALDRAGLVGGDGETHHGVFDLALLRAVPGLTILSPAGRSEMALMLRYAFAQSSPVVIRYPRAVCAAGPEALTAPLQPGRGVLLRAGESTSGGRSELLIISLGGILPQVLSARELLAERGVEADVYNLRFARPLDENHLCDIASGYTHVLTVEEGATAGGVGEAVAGLFLRRGLAVRIRCAGVPDRFITHGRREELLAACGLSAEALAENAADFCASSPRLRIIRAAT